MYERTFDGFKPAQTRDSLPFGFRLSCSSATLGETFGSALGRRAAKSRRASAVERRKRRRRTGHGAAGVEQSQIERRVRMPVF